MAADTNKFFCTAFKGCATVSFPADWGESPEFGWRWVKRSGDWDKEAGIRFPALSDGRRRVFAVWTQQVLTNCYTRVRLLTPEEEEKFKWGVADGSPWEAARVSQHFGSSWDVESLDSYLA